MPAITRVRKEIIITHSFKKGDRVRLYDLTGKLWDQVITLNDAWDEDNPHNAEYWSGNSLQTWHTDLMKHEDDASPVEVPDGGMWFICRGNAQTWGRAQTEKGAIANMRQQGGKVTAYVVHRVSKWTAVDGLGSLSYPKGFEPVEVKRIDPPKK